MAARLLSVWITVISSVFVSCCALLTANNVGNLYDTTQGGKPLPAISEYFYPPATAIYYFPAIVFFGALAVTIWSRRNADQCLLFCVAGVAITIVFIAICGFALTLPFSAH